MLLLSTALLTAHGVQSLPWLECEKNVLHEHPVLWTHSILNFIATSGKKLYILLRKKNLLWYRTEWKTITAPLSYVIFTSSYLLINIYYSCFRSVCSGTAAVYRCSGTARACGFDAMFCWQVRIHGLRNQKNVCPLSMSCLFTHRGFCLVLFGCNCQLVH